MSELKCNISIKPRYINVFVTKCGGVISLVAESASGWPYCPFCGGKNESQVIDD